MHLMQQQLKKLQTLALAALTAMLLTGCFGQHNKAVSEGVNLESERIYGNSREAEPRQLNNTYPDDDGSVLQRANDIRAKFFPKDERIPKEGDQQKKGVATASDSMADDMEGEASAGE